ncbi:hypothetical protein HY065_00905 [Candidatus Berkelbacteria bacterium]|nr:hypothetical protein [Candidatus Berkelbacteria bacterium]
MYTLLLGAATADGSLAEYQCEWDPRPCLCVMMASCGYPGTPITGRSVYGLHAASQLPDIMVHYRSIQYYNPLPVTTGGRVLDVAAKGANLTEARHKVYNIVGNMISFEGAWWRDDIGKEE